MKKNAIELLQQLVKSIGGISHKWRNTDGKDGQKKSSLFALLYYGIIVCLWLEEWFYIPNAKV